jgi:asparagine synthase (glutamine-hydrolysing)
MLKAMEHRGPDGDGIYVAPSGACVLGHRRLSILDLSDAAAQPMVSLDKGRALSFNGEIYNYLDLKERLSLPVRDFQSSGDTELLFKWLQHRGGMALADLNGMFAFAYWDDQVGELMLARDGFGQKCLFYYDDGEVLVFASELRALVASGLVPRKISQQASLNYLAYGWIQEPQTILEGVKILSAGHLLRVSAVDRKPVLVNHARPSTRKVKADGPALRQAFSEAVERTLISDVPIGLFLSGGIDSAAIAAMAVRRQGASLRTLTVTFPDLDKKKSEGEGALRTAQYLGTDHSEVHISSQDLLGLLPQALDAMDQPSMDGLNIFLVSYGARQAGLKVALSGLGGDELFGGYHTFRDIPRQLWLRRHAGRLAGPLKALGKSQGPWHGRLEKMIEILQEPATLMAQYHVRRKLFSFAQIKRLVPEAGHGDDGSLMDPYLTRLLDSFQKEFALPDAIGLFEAHEYMSRILLKDSDVMGMAHSLEIRCPFLDREFSQLAQALPAESRVPRCRPKDAFVQALAGDLPPSVFGPKRGFSLPFQQWQTKELRADISETLHGLSRHLPWIDQRAVDSLWQAFLTHPQRVGWARPWSLFVLARYARNLAVQWP